MSAINSELISLTDWRNQQEILNGVPNLYHNDQLSTADAERINSSINIIGFAGAHGNGDGFKPTDKQYQEMADIVAGLDAKRGDVLFVEGCGYDTPVVSYPFSSGQLTAIAQELRSRRNISAFDYAEMLAVAKGVPTVTADMDAVHWGDFNAVSGGSRSRTRQDERRLRERQAANTVKDSALAALPGLTDEKPTYALLFGGFHFKTGKPSSIPRAFEHLGLKLETIHQTRTSRPAVAYSVAKGVLKELKQNFQNQRRES